MAAPMLNFVTRRILAFSRSKSHPNQLKYISTSHPHHSGDKDIEKLFVNRNVQAILKRITGFDLFRINAPQLAPLQESTVKLLTDKQLQEAQKEAEIDAQQKIQMPPVMNPRVDDVEILSDNPEIEAALDHPIVFTDITYGVPDRERFVVVRETDGKLRTGTWNEKERMSQIYFPVEGRKLRAPKMFEPENMQTVLDEERYLYLLERACLQFEPDDPKFIEVTTTTYNYIQNKKHYDTLRSSRHFGPMSFYYTIHKAIDNLIIYFLNGDELNCASDLVRLYNIIHTDSKSATVAREQNVTDDFTLVELYCNHEAENKGEISLLLQSHKEQAERL